MALRYFVPDLEPCNVEEGGGDVDVADQLGPDCPLPDPGAAHQEGHLGVHVKGEGLPLHQPVLT